MSETIEYTAYQLATFADCHSPDSLESPGANFLVGVADDLAGLIQRVKDGEDLSDVIHEEADSSVPVYTYTMWKTFTDLAAWEEDVSEWADDEADMTKLASLALYQIASRLLNALYEQHGEEDTEEEDSDDENTED